MESFIFCAGQVVIYIQYWENQQNVDDETAEVFVFGVTRSPLYLFT